MWCVPNLTPVFRERMDDILALYTEPLKPGHELHCFDETPKQLLGTPHGAIKAEPGKLRCVDYQYSRNGRVNVFVVVAPFLGTRTVTITARRTAQDTADFLWNYCMVAHETAEHLHLVLDNLNTHTEKSLRKIFGTEKAEAFFLHVTLHFTPCHASWLNMAEIEIGCVKRQGLKRRIPRRMELEETAKKIVAWRNLHGCKIQWSFTKERAMKKFPCMYSMAEN